MIKGMNTTISMSLSEEDLLRIEQIVLDHDAEEALLFITEVVKKKIDRENNSKMKRENI